MASNGAVVNGFDLVTNGPDTSPTTLESETAALRGLLEAYLATSDSRYRTLAISIYGDLQQRFWMDDLRCFRTTVDNDDLMQYTQILFGLLEGALRQYYKLVASDPGRATEAAQLLQEIKRTYKLPSRTAGMTATRTTSSSTPGRVVWAWGSRWGSVP